MKKNVPNEVLLANAARKLKEAADALAQSAGVTEGCVPLAPPAAFITITHGYPYPEKAEMADFDFRDVLRSIQEAEGCDTDEFDDEDCDCDDWDDEGDCPDYDPISEDNDRCLFLCPCCGTCMKKHLEEELV